jgi:hypothetical protein
MSDSPNAETVEASQLEEMQRAAANALAWVDAVGPAEALHRVSIHLAALCWISDNAHPCAGSA